MLNLPKNSFMNQSELAVWLLLTSTEADPSWLGNHSNKSTRRALRIASQRLCLAPCDVSMEAASTEVISWLCSPIDELMRSLGFASLMLFKNSIGPLLVAGEIRNRWVDLLGMESIIQLLRLTDEGGQIRQLELIPDWSSEWALFHPGLALTYALLLNKSLFLATRLLQRFDKKEVQGMYDYLALINAEKFIDRESLIFGRRRIDDDHKVERLANIY